MSKAYLLLENEVLFEGKSFGKRGKTFGEIVFCTSMTGYQEILTDPSYKGQIVVLTYPLIGNYGIHKDDDESIKPWVNGFVIKEPFENPYHKSSISNLEKYLIRNNITAIKDVPTREITKIIRDKGSMKACIFQEGERLSKIKKELKNFPSIVGKDLVKEVTIKDVVIRKKGNPFIAVYDFGCKESILKNLEKLNLGLRIYPADFPAEDILKEKPEFILLSNGPGDPEPLKYAIKNVQKILGKIRIYGICLGHQILGLAIGAKTYKLKFGHRGANHPVKNLKTGKVRVTTQNHGFAVNEKTLPKEVKITHISLFDNTLEGMESRKLKFKSVQFHPEASPGPRDEISFFEFIY